MDARVRQYVMTEAWRLYKLAKRHNESSTLGDAMKIAYRAAKVLLSLPNFVFYTEKK